ncbi:MAG TPA: hypothetical protein VM432_06835 [Bdellovibrionales bacterium]|nr:hypothetical protein [Bdellovibrionales bacterium]
MIFAMTARERAHTFISSAIQASIADNPSLFPETTIQRFSDASVADPHRLVRDTVEWAKQTDDESFREFTQISMGRMAELCEFEEFYRTFDAMDEILGLDYSRDLGMRRDQTTDERLYEGAGIGVQSSYTTLLVTLNRVSPKQGATFVDLGSGYGRAGLVIGLLRPDMNFIGYEYVGHRVEIGIKSAARVGVSDKIQFKEQDLSAADFAIPVADVYYLFDPFTEETYKHVFEQINKIGRQHSVAVVAKGGAVKWFEKVVANECWSQPEIHDIGTLAVYRSAPEV